MCIRDSVDLQHLYIDGSKFEANANKYTWVWKKAAEKFRYKLYEKITAEIEAVSYTHLDVYKRQEVEYENYCKHTRVEEIMDFAKKINAKKIGIATCVGLLKESRILADILRRCV